MSSEIVIVAILIFIDKKNYFLGDREAKRNKNDNNFYRNNGTSQSLDYKIGSCVTGQAMESRCPSPRCHVLTRKLSHPKTLSCKT